MTTVTTENAKNIVLLLPNPDKAGAVDLILADFDDLDRQPAWLRAQAGNPAAQHAIREYARERFGEAVLTPETADGAETFDDAESAYTAAQLYVHKHGTYYGIEALLPGIHITPDGIERG